MAKAKQTDDLTPTALDQLATAVASRIETDKVNDLEESERILRLCVEEDREPTFDEARWLWSKMRWDDREVYRQKTRMAKVYRLQAVAGTSEDRARLQAEAEQAKAVLDANAETLRQEIQDKQNTLRSLEQSVSQSAKRLEEVNVALTQLAEMPPQFILEDAKRIKRHGAATFRKRMNEIEVLLSSRAQMVAGPKPNYSHDTWIGHIKIVDSHAVQPAKNADGRRGLDYEVNPIRWEKIKADWEAERPALEAELEKLRQEWALVESDIERMHKYYHR